MKKVANKRSVQDGTVAIEFAIVLPVFIAIIYAMAGYGTAFLMAQNFTHASEEFLRESLAQSIIGCQSTSGDCETASEWTEHVNAVITSIEEAETPTRPNPLQFEYDAAGEGVPGPGVCEPNDTGDIICEVSFSASPLLTPITLPGLGDVPNLPEKLRGRASLLM